MPELESSRPSVTALNSIGIVGVCTIWDNKRVNGLLIYGKNIDCQLSPSVDSSYYYTLGCIWMAKKDKVLLEANLLLWKDLGRLWADAKVDIFSEILTRVNSLLLTQRIRKSLEACNFLTFEIFYIEMKHPDCYIILRLTLLAYNAHNAMYILHTY